MHRVVYQSDSACVFCRFYIRSKAECGPKKSNLPNVIYCPIVFICIEIYGKTNAQHAAGANSTQLNNQIIGNHTPIYKHMILIYWIHMRR